MTHVTGGASTQSRAIRPGMPTEIIRCSGAYEYTRDGRKILSWPMAQCGPILGHPSMDNEHTAMIVGTLAKLMSNGDLSIGSYAPRVEADLARIIVNLYSDYLHSGDTSSVRFSSNGTDVTQAAVALARHATGRRKIISIGYHGGSSPVFGFPPQNSGIIEENGRERVDVDFGDYDDWRKTVAGEMWLQNAAAIIVEVPPATDESLAGYTVSKIHYDSVVYGAKLIVDEIVTGFRYGLAGACGEYFLPGMRADFICLGKAMSTFGKLSALIGPRDIMDSLREKVFFSYTYNDHPFNLTDSLLTINHLRNNWVSIQDHINNIGRELKNGLNNVFNDFSFPFFEVIGHPSRTSIEWNGWDRAGEFMNTLVNEHNVLIHRPQFATMAHTMNDVEYTVVSTRRTLKLMGL